MLCAAIFAEASPSSLCDGDVFATPLGHTTIALKEHLADVYFCDRSINVISPVNIRSIIQSKVTTTKYFQQVTQDLDELKSIFLNVQLKSEWNSHFASLNLQELTTKIQKLQYFFFNYPNIGMGTILNSLSIIERNISFIFPDTFSIFTEYGAFLWSDQNLFTRNDPY